MSHTRLFKSELLRTVIASFLLLGMGATAVAKDLENVKLRGEYDWFDNTMWIDKDNPSSPEETRTVPTDVDRVNFDVNDVEFLAELKVGSPGAVAQYVTIADASFGNLVIENGGTLSSYNGSIGRGSNSLGTVLVRDAGSTWIMEKNLVVGIFGTAKLLISNGGVVSNTFADIGLLSESKGWSCFDNHGNPVCFWMSDTVVVSGAGSAWLNSGELKINENRIDLNGSSLLISHGGLVSSNGGRIAWGGGLVNSRGVVSVVDHGSTWANSGELIIGDTSTDFLSAGAGTGYLEIGRAGMVSNTSGNIGRGSGSVGWVTVDVGTWTNNGDLTVGDAGTGTLTIDHGLVNVEGALTLAKKAGAHGTLNLSTGSVLNATSVHGGAGTATLSLNPSGDYYFTHDGTSAGNPVIITGSTTVNLFGSMFLTGSNTYSGATKVNSGTLSVNGSIANSTTTVNAGGKLGGTGTVGTVNVNGGTVAPGNSAGTLTVNGDFSSNGTLVFEIGGLASGTYDVLDIHGNATFNGGNVQLNVINGYGGADGNWDFLLANTVTGWENLSVSVNGLPPGKWWRISPRDGGGERLSISSRFESPAPADNPTQISHAEISGGTWMGDAAGSAGFIPTTGNAKSPPNLPPGYTFPHSLFDFVLTGGVAGSTATITFTYPTALPPGTVYWKYGPSPDGYGCSGDACAEAHWYKMPMAQAVVAGNTMTLTITDGGVGDDDLTANGIIVDSGGPGVPIVTSIPTLSEWGMITLISLLALSTFFTLKRQRLMRPSEV